MPYVAVEGTLAQYSDNIFAFTSGCTGFLVVGGHSLKAPAARQY
jgi:hypothetical protein